MELWMVMVYPIKEQILVIIAYWLWWLVAIGCLLVSYSIRYGCGSRSPKRTNESNCWNIHPFFGCVCVVADPALNNPHLMVNHEFVVKLWVVIDTDTIGMYYSHGLNYWWQPKESHISHLNQGLLTIANLRYSQAFDRLDMITTSAIGQSWRVGDCTQCEVFWLIFPAHISQSWVVGPNKLKRHLGFNLLIAHWFITNQSESVYR